MDPSEMKVTRNRLVLVDDTVSGSEYSPLNVCSGLSVISQSS